LKNIFSSAQSLDDYLWQDSLKSFTKIRESGLTIIELELELEKRYSFMRNKTADGRTTDKHNALLTKA